MQIVPGQLVQLTYLVPNPADNTLYYPQAVVKNTQSGAIIATVNLTQDPTQHIRYTGAFIAPADSVGTGYFMDSVCIPYTDTGHTTPSGVYGAALTEFFAFQLPSTFSGGGGSEIIFDYKRMEDLLDGKFKDLKFPESQNIEFPAFPEFPEYKETDLSPVLEMVRSLSDAVQQVIMKVNNLPEPEKVDLGPIMNNVSELRKHMREQFSDHKSSIEERLSSFEETMGDKHKSHVDEMKKNVKDALEGFGSNGIPITFMSYQKTDGDKPPSQKDIYSRLRTPKKTV